MIVFGYCKGTLYSNQGTLLIKVRIPSIHGPYSLKEYSGQKVHNYVKDEDLPYYQSLVLPYVPSEGQVVALEDVNGKTNDFLVIGITGGSYNSGGSSNG